MCDASGSTTSAWSFGAHIGAFGYNQFRSKGLCEDFCIEQYWAQTTETASCCEYVYYSDFSASTDDESGVECYFYEASPGTHTAMDADTLSFLEAFMELGGLELDSFGAWTMEVGEVEGAMKFGASLVAAAAMVMTLY